VRGLEFDEDQRDAVDKPDQVGPALVEITRDPELRGKEEVVVGRSVPVDHPHGFMYGRTLRILVRDFDSFLEELVDLPVRIDRAHGAPVTDDLTDRFFDCHAGQIAVQPFEHRAEPLFEHDFGRGFPSLGSPAGQEGFIKTVGGFPFQIIREEGDGGLFHKSIFGIFVKHREAAGDEYNSSMFPGKIRVFIFVLMDFHGFIRYVFQRTV